MDRSCRPSLNLLLGQRGTKCPPETGGTWHPRATPKGTQTGNSPLCPSTGTSHYEAASPLRDRSPCQPPCLASLSPQPALLRSAVWWPLTQAVSTREEPMGCPQAQDAWAPAVLTGHWEGQNYPHSISPAIVSLSPWSLWVSTETSHSTTWSVKGYAPHHTSEWLSVPSALITPSPALQSHHRHPGWRNSFGTARYPSLQASQGCSRYFSSFLDSSASEAGLFLGHEGVLQALQRMRKRMRMSSAMTQLKEIATIAPVERAAPIATVLREKAGPAARLHTWGTRAALECAASTHRH